MTVLSAQTIRQLSAHGSPLVVPFSQRSVRRGMSFGLSACGYDVRLAQDLLLWPKSNRLGSTVERFNMPLDVMARVCDKSSWARRFVFVNNTIIEPGWRGYLTLELVNRSWRFVRLREGTPIAQIVFERLDQPTEYPYRGKYQDQPPGPQPTIEEPDAVVMS